MAYNDYQSAYFRLELNTDVVFRLLGNVEKRNLVVLNKLLKSYFSKAYPDSASVRFSPIMANDEIMKVESTDYDKLKEIHEKFTGEQLLAFEISEYAHKVVDWLLERKEKNLKYRIVSLFDKDLSIVFDEPSVAMEFKLRHAPE